MPPALAVRLPIVASLAAALCMLAAPVQAANRQACSASQLAVLGRAAQVPHFAWRDDDPAGVLRDAACKAAPGAPGTTIAVVAWSDGHDDRDGAVPGLIAVLDDAAGRVVASLREDFQQDALTVIQEDVLHVDTAPYLLAPGVRAFGIDTGHAGGPRYADGGVGPSRSLYVREGRVLRQVMADLDLEAWMYLPGHEGWRDDADDVQQENFQTVIAIGPQSSHGWHDLVLTSTSDGKRPSLHVRVPYDGRVYPLKPFEDAYWHWRR
jgi:hypothetical protein